MKMNSDILNVIMAVKSYKEYIYNDRTVKNLPIGDLHEETMSYYCSLPLPTGMRKNNDHFNRVERIMQDPRYMDELLTCEKKNLSDYPF